MSNERASPGAVRLLRCSTCGRAVAYSDPEMFDCIRNGWPTCCGETMTLFIEAFRPGDEHPKPPPK